MSELFIKRGDTAQGLLSLAKIKRLADSGILREFSLMPGLAALCLSLAFVSGCVPTPAGHSGKDVDQSGPMSEEEVDAPPRNNNNNNNNAAKTHNVAKKLTPKQVEEILAYEIGRWETTGQGIPTGGEPQVIKNTMDVRWKEKGKSLEYEFSLMQNGKKVTYSGHKKYDHAQSIFIVHLKWGDNPKTVTHEVYDPYTRTYQGQSAPTSPPSKNTSTNLMQRVSNNKLLNTLKVFEDDQLVYVQELVSLRHSANTEPANTEPAKSTHDDAITAIQKLGGKVTVDENNDAVKVRLGYSKITDAGLEHLKGFTELKELFLNNTDITDAGLVHLKGLANLELLIIRKTKVTDAGVVHLNGLTKLQGLGFTRTNVTDAALVHVESLTNLERLWLTDTRITDAGLVHLKGLTNLQGLNLSNTKITDAGLVYLKEMTRLQGLGLWDTKVTDAGLVHLKGLTKLEALGLKNTQVSDAAVKKFQHALPNCKVER